MSRYHSYIRSAAAILNNYKGKEPFSAFLKKQFAANKKFGSSDRKFISELCFGYFRASPIFQGLSVEEGLVQSYFLLQENSGPFISAVRAEWLSASSLPLVDKLAFLGKNKFIFPLASHLSPGIDKDQFAFSLLKQPSTFLRLRPGKGASVLHRLKVNNIPFKVVEENAVELSPSAKLENIFMINRDAVIQDLSSQQVLDSYMNLKNSADKNSINAWDCCSGSGGKSILLYDKLNGKVNLTVSDVREKILLNLKERLQQAEVPVQKWFAADITEIQTGEKYDVIICDAPCTGSGTWARTPEQLFFFNEKSIIYYSTLQKKIVANTLSALSPNGFYIYITCSVFEAENESVVGYIRQKGLRLLNETYHKGYGRNADTLFSAVFTTSSF